MYIYQMSFPIDFFGVMRKIKDVYELSLQHGTGAHDHCYDCTMSTTEIHCLLRRSLRALARMRTYWEGDVRTGDLYIGSVPGNDDYNDSHYFIALKQDNNGSSYIISQVEFRHLHESLVTEDLGSPITQCIQDGIKAILDEYTPCATNADQEVF